MKITKQQQQAVKRILNRINTETNSKVTYKELRKKSENGWGCVMVPFAGMCLGVEKDGYTHS